MRHWLNPSNHWDTGSISSDVGIDRYDGDFSLEASLNIRDCSRKISLAFGAVDRKTIAQRRNKLDIIRKHLDNIDLALDQLEQEVE